MSEEYFYKNKISKLESLDLESQLDMIFMWVKTGHINKTIFKRLLSYINVKN